MKIVKTVKAGEVKIVVREYSDKRCGFDWREGDKRKQGRWRDPADAVEAARLRANVIAAGRVNLLEISPAEFAEFRAWKARNQKSRTVQEIRDELLTLKRDDFEIDPHYVEQLVRPWAWFCDAFGTRSIADIAAGQIEDWLRSLNKNARNRNNIRDAVVQLFRFARERDYLQDAITAAERVKRLTIKQKSDDIEIWSPGEMVSKLSFSTPEILPWLVIGAFAGIRTEEMRPKENSRKEPLAWEDFQWSEKQIVVRAETSKVNRTRFVPIADNLAAWLEPFRGASGPVIAMQSKQFLRAVAKHNVAYGTARTNALRHSYGSYRNAIIRNIGQVAEEMGNSPGIARRNYERPQPRAVAEEWFSIQPPVDNP
jgi:integrase